MVLICMGCIDSDKLSLRTIGTPYGGIEIAIPENLAQAISIYTNELHLKRPGSAKDSIIIIIGDSGALNSPKHFRDLAMRSINTESIKEYQITTSDNQTMNVEIISEKNGTRAYLGSINNYLESIYNSDDGSYYQRNTGMDILIASGSDSFNESRFLDICRSCRLRSNYPSF
jgi:hypothetical protein